ncbi:MULTISPECIES: potassium channel family protein [unclassified Afipia]|uniref:potassium channel family protein n=1 Tax=unclassified Afipia TaxID=2642050 RepID=UPI00046435DF|nr:MULTISPECIES: potassium channel family protein [unclassified Afipia]
MRSLALGLKRLCLGFWHGLSDPEFQAIIFLLIMSVLGGSIFYHWIEGWSWLDSAYFSVVALTTVGDATLGPTSGVSKIFTMIFSLVGIGLVLAFLSRLSSYRDRTRED